MTAKSYAVNEKGRRIGEDHPQAKLSNAQVDEIFVLREHGFTLSQIARRFGVTKGAIWKILQGWNRNHTIAGWCKAGPPRAKSPRPARTRASQKAQEQQAPSPESAGALVLQDALSSWR